MDCHVEQWRPICGFEGHYEVSNYGQVRSVDRVLTYPDGHLHRLRGLTLSPGAQPPYGHLHVNLKTQRGKRSAAVHALVLEAFVGPRPAGYECLHRDGDPRNNRLDNLRWGTRSENNLDTVRHGTHAQARKTHCPRGHPYVGDNLIATRRGRECYACKQIQWRSRPLKPQAPSCRRGHEYTAENTRMTDRGRMCLACFRGRMAERREIRAAR